MIYSTPEAFKQALETRLRRRYPDTLARRRQLFIFSRFLARVATVMGNAATLKGGVALELRLAGARSTKDIDLSMYGRADRDRLLAQLEEAARLDTGDFLEFEVELDAAHPELTGDGIKYDGYRFRASCRLAAKAYGRPHFGIDVAFGNPMLLPVDELVTEDWLDFVGIPPARIPAYPIETHLAEKLHAYTIPRAGANSRLKDLPDLALLATIRDLSAARVSRAIVDTFTFRDTHPPPSSVPAPPADWSLRYPALAEREALPWPTLDAVVAQVRRFLDPLLGGADVETWDHAASAWR